jgi:hypothetical protein
VADSPAGGTPSAGPDDSPVAADNTLLVADSPVADTDCRAVDMASRLVGTVRHCSTLSRLG